MERETDYPAYVYHDDHAPLVIHSVSKWHELVKVGWRDTPYPRVAVEIVKHIEVDIDIPEEKPKNKGGRPRKVI